MTEDVKKTVDQTLEERGKVYGGSFLEQSQIAQQLKGTIRRAPNYDKMRVDQREALDVIATKISRLLYGDPNHIDSWHDIAGYARLIERELIEAQERKNDV